MNVAEINRSQINNGLQYTFLQCSGGVVVKSWT